MNQRKRNIDNKMDDDDLVGYGEPKISNYSTAIAFKHEFYFTGEINSPEYYTDWFQIIRAATENDVIILHINSRGGDASTAIQFLRVLRETSAVVCASVEGECMSAATMIFLSADQFQISEHSNFMFHNYSGAVVGKGGEMYDSIMHERKWSEGLLRGIYKDFLTEEEVLAILDNKDIWMNTDDVMKRLENREKIRDEKIKEEIEKKEAEKTDKITEEPKEEKKKEPKPKKKLFGTK